MRKFVQKDDAFLQDMYLDEKSKFKPSAIVLAEDPEISFPSQSFKAPLDLSYFPATRFYGSKRKQLNWLQETFRSLPGKTIFDAFGGTGTVSLLFQRLGRHVTYNDVFRFNQICFEALSSDSTKSFSTNQFQRFCKDTKPVHGFISKTFEGIFFRAEENMWLDGFMIKLKKSQLPIDVKHMLLYCLFQACLKKRPFNLFHRANLNLRNSDVKVSFGNRATWEKSFSTHMLEAYVELCGAQAGCRIPAEILKNGPAENVKKKFDIVYLDPPYFHANRTTEPYLDRYHFLEGLARYNEWPLLVDMNSPTRTFRRDFPQGEWIAKFTFFDNLKNLISAHQSSTVILSYVANSYPSEYALTKFFKETFSNVVKKKRTYNRALSGKSRNEILLIGKP